jgi:hypothetical protein
MSDRESNARAAYAHHSMRLDAIGVEHAKLAIRMIRTRDGYCAAVSAP